MIFNIPYEHKIKSGIYIIKSLIDNRIYIGGTKKLWKRFLGHRLGLTRKEYRNYYLQEFVNEHGLDVLSFELLELVPDHKRLLEREQYWIDILNPVGENRGFNCSPTAGNCKGVKHREDVIIKKSGTNNPNYGKRGADAPTFGYRHTEETKKIIAEAARKGRTGIKTSDETKEKLRQINLGKKIPKEVSMKWGENRKGSNNPTSKKVLNTATGEIYDCARLAAESNGMTYDKIRKLLSGYRENKTPLRYL